MPFGNMARNLSNIEQFMNDATSSVFSKFLNVGKRKKDYVWHLNENSASEENVPMETEVTVFGGFWEVTNSNNEVEPRQEIEKNTFAPKDKTEINRQDLKNRSEPRSFDSRKMPIAIKHVISYQESDILVNNSHVLSDQMVPSAEEEIVFDTEQSDNFNKKHEYQTKYMSMQDGLQKAQTERKPILSESFHVEDSISLSDKTNTVTETDYIFHKSHKTKNLKIKFTPEATNITDVVYQRSRTDENEQNGRPNVTAKTHDYKTESLNKQDEFQDWCLKRQIAYLRSPKLQVSVAANNSLGTHHELLAARTDSKQKQTLINQDNTIHKAKHVNERSSSFSISESKQKVVDQDINNDFGQIKPTKDKKQQTAANESPKQKVIDQHITIDTFKRIKSSQERKRHNSANEYCSRKERNYGASKICSGQETHPKEESSETSINCTQTMLLITVMKDEKMNEIVTVLHDLLRMKKNFPKFAEVIPDVDCDEKEFNFSFDAVKTVLAFMCNPSYNFSAIQNEMLAVEILALLHAWEITRIHDLFHKYFLQNILTESNADKIYSLASMFHLDEIKEACKDLVKDAYSVKFRQKKCSVAISTYIEPVEYCLPLDSVKEQLSESFNRSVRNEIFFKSISGCFVIKGIQVAFNVDKLDKSSISSKVEIYYSAANLTEKIEIQEQKAQKHLGSFIFIYFNKNLVIKPNQTGKIEVYTDVKPRLCYTFQKDTLVEKCSKGKFSLTLKSNYKIENSDLKVFFVGKLLYHIKPNASG